MHTFEAVMFKRLWTFKSRKRGYDVSHELQTSTAKEIDVSSSYFDLNTPDSHESEVYQPSSESSAPRKRLFQEFDLTDQITLSQSRPNWKTNLEGHVYNDEYLTVDPDTLERTYVVRLIIPVMKGIEFDKFGVHLYGIVEEL